MTDNELFQRVKKLFDTYQDDFGCRNNVALYQQCKYKKSMTVLLCEYQGPHDFVPDMCGNTQHDFCARCGIIRKDIEIEN